MSAIQDCPGCQTGHHERHVGPWNVRDGVLGGAECCCPGDCAERHEAEQARMVAHLNALTPPAAPPPDEGETERNAAHRLEVLAAAEVLRPQVDRDRKTAYWQDRQGQLDGIALWLDSLIDWAQP